MTDQDYNKLDATEPLGMVRALIPDMEKLTDPAHPEKQGEYLFGDSTLGRYLYLAGGKPRDKKDDFIPWDATNAQAYRAAAAACEALGRSEMLILKKITSEDLNTDGSVLAAQYRQMSAQLRGEADRMENADADNEPEAFVIPFVRRPAQFDADMTARERGAWA